MEPAPPEPSNAPITPDGIDILYHDGPCLVVSKPGGLLTQAPPGIDSVEVRVKAFFKQREQKTGNVYLGVPHRLDRPASGALVVARHVRAARRLAQQFEGRLVEKTYWAVVEGTVSEDTGHWHDFLRKIPGVARAEIVPRSHPEGRHASLAYRVLARTDALTVLEIQLETGRTHQIRIQAANRGHPILGDFLYGSTLPFGPEVDDPRARWIALHARRLGFRHPMTRAPVSVTAPLPEWWEPFESLLDGHA